jgi:hypothetical protein
MFGDVNEIIFYNETLLVYPHQLKVVSNSDLMVEIITSYFRGSHYLIEAKYGNQTLFFENEQIIEKAEMVFLTIK